MIEIIKYLNSPNKIRHQEQIKSIFASSSDMSFSNTEAVNSSFKKWTEFYLDRHPDWVYIALKGGQCVGYLMACPNSQNAEKLFHRFESYDVFSDHFSKYPAHLHINVHEELRGSGVGRLLIDQACQDLKLEKTDGLHIVTSPSAKNVNFYQKQGFSFELQRDFKDFKLLFMGKSLATA